MISTAVLADDAGGAAAIQQLWDEYQTYVVAGDDQTWIGSYDPEGIQMPLAAPMRNYEAVVEDAKTGSVDDVDAMSTKPMETVILGDMTWSMGTSTLDFTANDAADQVEGKFMTILIRQDDGSWKIYRGIFNSDK